jgi:hypothetical protein
VVPTMYDSAERFFYSGAAASRRGQTNVLFMKSPQSWKQVEALAGRSGEKGEIPSAHSRGKARCKICVES